MKVSAVSFSFLFIFIFSIFALTPAVAAGPDLSIGIYGGAAGGSLSCDGCDDGLDRDRASVYGVNARAFWPLVNHVSIGAEAGFVTGPAANIKVDGENVADLRNRLGYFVPMLKLSSGKLSLYGGAGVGYSRSRYFDEEFSDVSAKRPALVAKAGAEVMIFRHVGLFADWQYSRVSDRLPDEDGEKFRVKNETSGVVGGIAVHF